MKKTLSRWKSDYTQRIWLLVCLAMAGSFIFSNYFSFSYDTDSNAHYELVYLLPFFPILLFIAYPKIIGPSSIYFLILIILNCSLLFDRNYSFSNQHFFILFSISCFFIIGLCIGLTEYLDTILLLVVAVYFYELIIGIKQATYDTSPFPVPVPITGTLQNQGVFACYVVLGFPFACYYIFSIRTTSCLGQMRWIRPLCVLLLLLVDVYILCLTESRTSLIASIFTFSAIVWYRYGSRVKQMVGNASSLLLGAVAIAAAFLFVVVGYYMFYFRSLSAFGRIMRWEITLSHWGDDFWLGTGLGRFTWYYPQWQAQYFQTHLNPPTGYFLSAGESFLIFNEYLQLFKEVGLIGLIAAIILLFYFFRSKSSNHKGLLDSAKATVIAILACGVTSYSLHVNLFIFLLCVCFLISIAVRENPPLLRKYQSLEKTLLASTLLLFAFNCFSGIRQLVAITEWNRLKYDYLLSRGDKKLGYARLYPILEYDGKFMTEYGKYLSRDSADCAMAAEILEQAKLQFISRKTIETTGFAYRRAKNYEKSIENYYWLSNFLPNLFSPKFKLLELYKQTNQNDKARQLAEVILKMPVKVPSAEVEQIKSSARGVLRGLK